VGDRIGTRVGKARLSLFKLRPRTAVVVTILTGSFCLYTGDFICYFEQLRTGVFELEKIQRDLRQRQDLQTTRQQLETTRRKLR